MQKSNSILAVVIICVFSTLNSGFSNELLIDQNSTNFGWQTFGAEFGPVVTEGDENIIRINVDWTKTEWGVGITFQTNVPIDGKEVEDVQAEIKATTENELKVYAGVSTKANGNMAQDSKRAIDCNEEWQAVEFPLIEMAMDFSKKFEPNFSENNSESLQIVNLFFLKPEKVNSTNDVIYVRNPNLTYINDDSYALR